MASLDAVTVHVRVDAPVFKQLGKAESLLADIQRKKDIPDPVRSVIREYFAEHERGQLIHNMRETNHACLDDSD